MDPIHYSFIAGGVIVVLTIAVAVAAPTVVAYERTKRRERREAERLLAYKALRGWGRYADPEREAFIDGWLDQVFQPGKIALGASDTEARRSAYLSGYIASRERDTLNPGDDVEVIHGS